MSARVVIGLSGASGAAVGVRAVELAATRAETHVVVSRAAERTIRHELGPEGARRLLRAAHAVHDIADVGATIASGSFRTAGMLIAPCSMRTLAAVASSLADSLLVRAADVHLKERRRLVLAVRETPLHLGHLRAMAAATELGAIVAPIAPAFYLRPATIEELVEHAAGRLVDLLGLDGPPLAAEWRGDAL
jgi:4-hydroxy-3-polyprenylbenzoate decarboxylase